jgi:hypothetical protein
MRSRVRPLRSSNRCIERIGASRDQLFQTLHEVENEVHVVFGVVTRPRLMSTSTMRL